jgi:tetratricopeptide (TPR) repeat protein
MQVLDEIKYFIGNNEIENALNLIVEFEPELLNNAEYWNLRGLLCLKVGEYETAISCFEESLSLDTKNGDTYYNLAFAHENLGEIREAAKYYGLSYRYTTDEDLKLELLTMYDGQNPLKEVFKDAAKRDLNNKNYN